MTIGLASLAVALAAMPAAAIDGEVLINQAKVNAGGITPGDSAGFPATLSRPGRYKLSSNLTVPAQMNGIEVTANDVTIDLNGFTIRSAQPGQAASGVVSLVGEGLLRVVNGTVTGFSGSGIVKSPGRAIIEDMRLLSNGHNLDLPGESQVRNSTIANGNSTFPNPGPAVRCFGACLIENNIITGNLGAGVASENGGTTVIGNVIVGNTGVGVFSSSTKIGFANNILIGNNGGGAQSTALAVQLHPNVCDPACP
jgi:Right handed beta helix region